jgi:hypothetical protein
MTIHEHPPTSASNLARLRVLILSRVTLRGRGWPGRCIFQGIWTVLLWFMAKHDIGAPQSIVRSSFAQNWQKWEFGQTHYIIHRFQAHPCDVVRDISHSYPSNSLIISLAPQKTHWSAWYARSHLRWPELMAAKTLILGCSKWPWFDCRAERHGQS